MSERNISTAEQSNPEKQAAIERAMVFLQEQVPVLCKLTGLKVNVEIGQGWATDLKTGAFTIDPLFFVEKGYSAEHSIHTTLHELLAHVRDVIRDPINAARQREFSKKQGPEDTLSGARHIFNNILTDIIGDKRTANLFPSMAEVQIDIYSNRLFPMERDGKPIDYATSQPLHLQFLYKMIRQEMIPGSDTPVRAEVDEALARLRNYSGTDLDVIEFLTNPGSKKDGEKLRSGDRWDYTLATIWPEYLALYELAKQEKQEQQQGESPNSNSQPGDSKYASSEQSDDPFAVEHQNYFDTKHPEPLSPEEEAKLDEMIKKAAKNQANKQPPRRNPRAEQDKRLRQETGYGTAAHQKYSAEIAKHRDSIEAMREVFRSVINERVAVRRGLSRHAYSDGDILDPNRLAQTFIDVTSGVTLPEAYSRYEHVRGRTEMIGKTDYLFVFDCSSSMAKDGRAQSAATTALIMLEALAGMERDIKEAERQYNIELDLDIRTALYIFSSDATCIKPLSNGLSDRERLTARHTILAPSGGTADFLALEQIAALDKPADRERIVIVVSDGESNDAARATSVINRLRAAGCVVYGVGIGSDDATALYAPDAARVNNPADLPGMLQSFIESTLQ